MDAHALLAELTSLLGPPGQEDAVREAMAGHVADLGYASRTDAKGNLLVALSQNPPKVVVTAHLDEIAMIVRELKPDGALGVEALGGLFPWKLGEGPVQVLGSKQSVNGILSFGSIHTSDPRSTVRQSDRQSVDWPMTTVITGRSYDDVVEAGVRVGSRVVVAPERRALFPVGSLIGGYFLDDRADLVSWLLALEELQGDQMDVLFAATASEEVGGEGALFLLQEFRPDICIALELGPHTSDAPVDLTDQPSVWVNDSYSATSAKDLDLVASAAEEIGIDLQFQALSRGGSDASCAASHGLCARPFTLGLPMDNSHGFEVMHPGAMAQLARLTVALLRRLR